MDTEQLFYTQNGYDRADTGPLTTAMEDYLEMICRLTRSGGYTRISALARELHVQPSSASKMAALLRSGGYLTNERYGCLRLTEKGSQAGAYLLYRHDVLNRLLRRINGSADELEQTERIEHYIDVRTVRNIDAFLVGLPARGRSRPPHAKTAPRAANPGRGSFLSEYRSTGAQSCTLWRILSI